VSRLLRVVARRRRNTGVALLLALILAAALLAPVIARHPPGALDPLHQLQGPSSAHWFGTDELGRDLFSRVLEGGRLTLTIMVAATAISLVLGLLWGALGAQYGRVADEVSMRLADGAMSIPTILSALVFVAALGASRTSLIVVLGILHAPLTARICRAAMLLELRSDYCVAALTFGSGRLRMLFREVLPNIAPVLMVQASLNAASVLVTEAALSFVGLGIQPPDATWGTLVRQGYAQIYSSYWFVTLPTLMIVLTIWALNALGDHAQAASSPGSGALR
jgi:peptide/nickel transport system permease protein